MVSAYGLHVPQKGFPQDYYQDVRMKARFRQLEDLSVGSREGM